jgi:hypothetical protein
MTFSEIGPMPRPAKFLNIPMVPAVSANAVFDPFQNVG